MEDKLTIDFGGGVGARYNYAQPNSGDHEMGNVDKHGLKVTLDNLKTKTCPHTVMINKLWSPSWSDYVHSYKYNYSITVNTDPNSAWYKRIMKQDRKDDHILIQEIRDEEEKRLKRAITRAYSDRVISNCTCVFEYGENNKRHYHMLVMTARKNTLKLYLEEEFDFSMQPKGSGWNTRDPINRIRPKKCKKCYDCRTATELAKEVLDAIDYIVYKYYQKEGIGENLLLNLVSKI